MKFQTRVNLWFLLLFVLGCVFFHVQVAESQAQYDAGDKSAMAWVGFWPFLFPIFLLSSAVFVVPVAIVTELVLWWRRKTVR